MPVITLLTDFGTRDGYAAVMKGVILGIAPQATLVDLSHDVAPQDILEAAFTLARHAFFFPPGTVHIAVVDPGVGTQRRPIAARLGDHHFVAPDNGLLTLVLERARQERWPIHVVHLDQPAYWQPRVSDVFHGRDLFAPVGAHLAAGRSLYELGTQIEDPTLLPFPTPQETAHGWRGEIVHIDHFGNLTTNLRRRHLAHMPGLRIALAGTTIHGLVRTFGERPAGTIVAVINSAGFLDISLVQGNAAAHFGVHPGEEVLVTPA